MNGHVKIQKMFKKQVNPDIYFWPLLPMSNGISRTLTFKTIHRYDTCVNVHPRGLHGITQVAVRKSSEPI